mgnify:CR=1 FL=1
MKKIIVLILLLNASLLHSQELIRPNFAMASHPIVLQKIRVTQDQLIINLSIENKVSGGNFCIDKDTYILDVLNRIKRTMVSSKNIPNCPEAYHFKRIGEKLNFELYFPLPQSDLKYLNLVEDCDANCLSLLGIILIPEMNHQIEKAFEAFDDGKYQQSENILTNTIKEYSDYPFGFLHLNLIQVLLVQEKIKKAREYLRVIKSSSFYDKNSILEQLKKYEELKN